MNHKTVFGVSGPNGPVAIGIVVVDNRLESDELPKYLEMEVTFANHMTRLRPGPAIQSIVRILHALMDGGVAGQSGSPAHPPVMGVSPGAPDPFTKKPTIVAILPSASQWSTADAIGMWNAAQIRIAGLETGWIGCLALPVVMDPVSAAEKLLTMVVDRVAFALVRCENPSLALRMKAAQMRVITKSMMMTTTASSANGQVGAIAIGRVALVRWYEHVQ